MEVAIVFGHKFMFQDLSPQCYSGTSCYH